ncbi:TonB-dependent receptor [Mitsuaria sp. BK045]|uniref:TonB-dependent receptor n=1 Tax=unclassified Roseateles TaxID=2626991 RepID=UPI0017FF9B83|nr:MULTISPECIES: TonB-dependent receptor [unclassified Roseateles]MBB3294870.1 TonB-dependent receptor [Mitsuaria sp. BK041]MBB3364086.1 TonB-dependent receptor [Mitsuaria sp. BK045]
MRAPQTSLLIARFAPRPVAAAAAIAALAAMGAAQAQVQPPAPAASEAKADAKARDADQTLERVEVTGTRASLQRSLNLKRSASGVQDSISATELGRFPDDNVADSLSHITGVSISRTAGGEGQKVSVRGLGPEYTLTTFNNRILATDGEGRDFAFDVLPSDIISGADVVKSAQASVMEGAIGGLVNLRSASPFDQPGQHALLRVEGDRNLMSRLNGGKLSATYSNTFGKELGVLVGLVYADRKVRTDTAGNDGGWTRNPIADPAANWTGNAWGGNIDPNGNGVLDPDEEGLIGPGQFRVGTIQEQKKRTALSGKVEWRPSEQLKVTVDGIRTRLDSPQVGYQQSFYTLFAPGRWSNMQIRNGVVTGFTMDNPDPEQRLNPELLNLTTHRVVDSALYGVNAEWKATETLKFSGDLYQSTSKRHSGGQDTYTVLRMNQPNVTTVQLTGSQVPSISTTFADGRDLINGLAGGQFGASDFNTHYLGLSGDNIDDKIRGLTLNGAWSVDRFNVDQIQFGVQSTRRDKHRDLVDNAINGGENYYSGANAINVGQLGGNVLDQHLSPPNFMNGVSGSFPRSFLGFDVPNYLAALQAYNGKPRPDGGSYDFSLAAPVWNPLQSYRVREKTTSFFIEADLSGERWNADIGVRLVKTKTSARAWDAKIESLTENSPFNYTAVYAAPTQIGQDASYTFGLPSANFVWHFTDQLQLRLGAAKTMARPSVEQLAPTSTTASVAWGDFTQVFGGNADLKPYSAKQYDASLEWYYARNSALTFAVFQKDIKNQITTSWQTGVDIGVPGHLFNVMKPINGDKAKVRGMEIGFQHLWDNGLGVRAQYTRNRSDSWVGGEKRPLEGIAPATSSLSLLYEKGPWSLSATADHTDDFVSAINVIGPGFNERAKAITWVTAQASYEFNKWLKLSIEGRNLSDAKQEYTLGNGSITLPQGYNRWGRAFTIGASIKF